MLAGDTIGHYKIVRKIDEGGMGEVFLAEDTELERPVALKILLPVYANDEDLIQRFIQEAKAASALNHQNILTIYEIGYHGDRRFIASEFVKGVTLRTRLKNDALTLTQILDITLQVAAALNAAHKAGITHRDIKPENIMLRDDDQVKILDFGLAKLSETSFGFGDKENADKEAATQMLAKTKPGIILGTVNYMSPEQARGTAVDARSDIWSLGVVLYEMLAGRTPFVAETTSDTIAAILIKDPEPLRDNVPERLRQVLDKTLQKKLAERYQSIREFVQDVKILAYETGSRVGSASSSAEITIEPVSKENATLIQSAIQSAPNNATTQLSSAEYIVEGVKSNKLVFASVFAAVALAATSLWYFGFMRDSGRIDSIAVLPFVIASGDTNVEYLSDGITETLINSISQIGDVRVTARSSSFKFKSGESDVVAAGNALGVDAILTGRITRSGDELQISVELTDIRDNSHVWGERYNRRMSDILKTQSEISREIAARLSRKLTNTGQSQLAKRETVNPQAYELVLRARHEFRKFTPESTKKAAELYEKAIQNEPQYALAYAEVATVYRMLGVLSVFDPKDMIPKAEAATLKALELDDELAEAHSSLAGIKRDRWDWAGAEIEYRRAIDLNPNFVDAAEGYAIYLSILGRHEEAIEEMRRARERDPLRLLTNLSYGAVFYNARRYDEAIDVFQKSLELDKNSPSAYSWLGIAQAAKGEYQQAITAYRDAIRLGDDTTSTLGYFAYALAKSGNTDEANQIIGRLQNSTDFVAPVPLAIAYAGSGKTDDALKSLESALAERDPNLQYLNVEPHLDSLQAEPRFREVMRKVGLLS